MSSVIAGTPPDQAKPQSPPLLELQGLTERYGGITALREVSFQVGSGELVALLGANGAGKTTTLKAISRLEPAAPPGSGRCPASRCARCSAAPDRRRAR
ncbi:MAG: ATP-binding cassette domain-containing protein, partial [Cyanobium sp.]